MLINAIVGISFLRTARSFGVDPMSFEDSALEGLNVANSETTAAAAADDGELTYPITILIF